MLQRKAQFDLKAANDNFMRPPRAEAKMIRFPRPKSGPFHLRASSLLLVGFAGLVLLALCGAFLLGLAAVGVLALAITVLQLIPHLRRKRSSGAMKRQVVRYS